MNYKQKAKYDRIFNEPIYLLNYKSEENNIIFDVSGSTAKIYHVDINKDSRVITCTCPDHYINCKRQGCVCKHCCFVLCKVLKFSTGSSFFGSLRFNDNHMKDIDDNIKKIDLANDNYANKDYSEKYEAVSAKVNESFAQKREVVKDHDVCCICYDDFTEEKDKNLECILCNNLIHKMCMEKWLQTGRTNCPYCRSDVWKKYRK